MKKYTEEKRSNPKADKPVKVKFSVLRRGIKSEEEADDFRDKKLDEADKKAEAKTDSKGSAKGDSKDDSSSDSKSDK